ncbi:MAG: class I SAM-dependent methyltransferase [Azospirillaceae bacterium]
MTDIASTTTPSALATAAAPADAIAPHNAGAAAVWDAGGAAYDTVSFAISDALAHAAQRLAPAPGDRVLDIATGTGWTARNAARLGARVTAVDIAPALLAAARELSAGVEPPIDYRLADAERLPFPDGAFDGVISTFGVMFAGDPDRAAAELARVCRPGGRLVLAVWTPDGAVATFFGLIAGHDPAPGPEPGPAGPSPLAWGDPEVVAARLGDAFDLVLEDGVNHAHHADEAAIRAWYETGFGPLRHLLARLDEPARAALRRDMDAYHAHYRTPAGLRVARDYRVVIGRRR